MKTNLLKKCILALSVALLTIVSCDKSKDTEEVTTPEVSLSLLNTDSESITFSVSAKGAESVAWYYTSDAEEGKKLLTSDSIFALGEEIGAVAEPQTVTIPELQPETLYWIYASAKSGDKVSATDSIQVHTTAEAKVLTAGDVTKTSLSYHINAKEGRTYRHAYVEKWYFDHMLASAMEDEGSEFSMDTFLWNLLADYGHEGTGSTTYTWRNGDEDLIKNKNVMLYGGQSYCALFSYIEGETGWTGKPEYVEMTLPEAGSAKGEITFTDELVTTEKISVRMVLGSDISFIAYNLYEKSKWNEKFSGADEKSVKDFLYEYGYSVSNTYTDGWLTSPGTEYVLAIMGVNKEGDSFLQIKEYTTPVPQPELDLKLRAYDRENEGYHGYNTIRVDGTLKYFHDLDTESILAGLMTKAQWDSTLQMFGATDLDNLMSTMPDYIYYVVSTQLQENEMTDIKNKGSFTRIESDLEPDTEYIFAIAFKYEDKWYYKTATATLDKEPDSEASTGYKAYLGNWTVTGKSTSDWSSALTYNIKVEQLTVNRSYKVYGWSTSSAGQEFPFIARYDSVNGKILIDGYQLLGKTTVEGQEYEVRMMGCLSYAGRLYMSDYDDVIYKGSIVDMGNGQEKISMFPEFFTKDGKSYEVQTMAYGFVKDGNIIGSPEEYDIVEFRITRNK